VVNALAPDSILLVGDPEGGLCGKQELRQGCSVGDDGMVLTAEDDIFDPEAPGAAALLGRDVSVFTNTEEVVEGHTDEVTNSLVLGI